MKKGIVSLWLSVGVSLLLIMFMLAFYLLFMQGSRAPEEIAALESSDIAAQNLLASLLDSQVVVDDRPVLFSDLVRLWYLKKASDEELSDYAKKFLAKAQVTGAGAEALPEFRTVLKSPEQARLVFWLSIQEKPRQEKAAPVFLVQPFGPAVQSPSGCLRSLSCPDAAGAFVPVSKSKAVYVALWQVAA